MDYLLTASLACWRITSILHSEAGPFRVAERLRALAPFECFLCVSVWVAAPLAAMGSGGWWARALLWPAISAGAVLVQRVVFPASLDGGLDFHED